MKNIYHEFWEQELASQFYSVDRSKCKAYICSPLGAETEGGFISNMFTARAYMYYAMKQMQMYASAPHAYLPMLLNDKTPSDRALGLDFGLRLLSQCDILLVCGNRITNGMKDEIERAIILRMPVIVFDEGVYWEVEKIISRLGGDKRNLKLDKEHVVMAMTTPVTYMKNAEMFHE